MAILGYLKSTILSKVVMAVTGVILVGFIIGHAVGNLQVFMGQEQYNHYAELLQKHGRASMDYAHRTAGFGRFAYYYFN